MNKQELIDMTVNDYSGRWPNDDLPSLFCHEIWNQRNYIGISQDEFKQRARELGYINGYRWGVEYHTDSKKPDLPDDVVVRWYDDCKSAETTAGMLNWNGPPSFKITDQRYKPADTSYLNNAKEAWAGEKQDAGACRLMPETISVNSTEWYDYDNQKALWLPPVGDKSVSYLDDDGVWIGCEVAAHYNSGAIVAHNDGFTLVYKHELRPNNFHARKAEQEREKVIKLAADKFHNSIMADYSGQPFLDGLGALYDAGFLRLPPQKD